MDIKLLPAIAFGGSVLLLAACLPGRPQPDQPSDGAQLYARYCADCHGRDGKGKGPAASGMNPPPADLTMLTRRNGGEFPEVMVMAKIYGSTNGKPNSSPMPQFAELIEGPMVLVETAPGIMTPTPEPLVALADHVEALTRASAR